MTVTTPQQKALPPPTLPNDLIHPRMTLFAASTWAQPGKANLACDSRRPTPSYLFYAPRHGQAAGVEESTKSKQHEEQGGKGWIHSTSDKYLAQET
ncbi:hypothetical protein J1614_012204 [Plenodomus biglobosus]|nr:hypothetical protein J1614_012204 [Plenodomus biglobosus]